MEVKESDRLGKNRKHKECGDDNNSEMGKEMQRMEGGESSSYVSLATVGIAATASHINRNTDEDTSRTFHRSAN
ncbi:unnamed protein product [Wuchereria bancrofti]|uniref:Uncharacterized protein n=1 Tax=Wuchereria bancrofti TaxID=6293 RepID=A0A3P7DPG0_WUCBA|nr:unnamed protein product [Wuchereria bancrofti]